jgi:putative oxidoreductase
VQRLFSTFPNGWPGRALLLLRLVAAAPLLQQSIAFVCGFDHSSVLPVELAALAAGALLTLGFCTPPAALVQAALEAWMALQSGRPLGEHTILAALGVGLMMLGPGAWSVDARLFGRRRIDLHSKSD